MPVHCDDGSGMSSTERARAKVPTTSLDLTKAVTTRAQDGSFAKESHRIRSARVSRTPPKVPDASRLASGKASDVPPNSHRAKLERAGGSSSFHRADSGSSFRKKSGKRRSSAAVRSADMLHEVDGVTGDDAEVAGSTPEPDSASGEIVRARAQVPMGCSTLVLTFTRRLACHFSDMLMKIRVSMSMPMPRMLVTVLAHMYPRPCP